MKEIVIDIVIVPGKKIMDMCYEMNKEIVKGGGNKIIFQEGICVPHISFLMGTVKENKILEIISDVKSVIGDTSHLELTIDKFSITQTPLGDNYYDLNIAKTNQIKNFHKNIFEKILSKLSFNATFDMLYQDSILEKITLSWINNHKYKLDYTKYRPHITIGVGGNAQPEFPGIITEYADTIGIYQLGNYCTCRKELVKLQL